MCEGCYIVAEYHLGNGDAEARGHVVYGAGLGDGQLAGRNDEVALRVAGSCGVEGAGERGGRVRFVGGGYVIHLVGAQAWLSVARREVMAKK